MRTQDRSFQLNVFKPSILISIRQFRIPLDQIKVILGEEVFINFQNLVVGKSVKQQQTVDYSSENIRMDLHGISRESEEIMSKVVVSPESFGLFFYGNLDLWA